MCTCGSMPPGITILPAASMIALGIRIRERARRRHRRDRLALDAHIAARHALRGHHVAAADDQVQHRSPRRSSFRSRNGTLHHGSAVEKVCFSRERAAVHLPRGCPAPRAVATTGPMVDTPRPRLRPNPGHDGRRKQRHEARHLPQLAAARERRSRAPLRRDGGAGAARPLARLRLDLGRRASRDARLPLLPAVRPAAAPRRRRRGHVDGHQRHPAAAAQPHRGGGGRRLPRRHHRRQVPARRRPRLPARGIRDVPRAHVGARQPLQRGRRDHRQALERRQGHPPGPPLAVHQCHHPPAPPAEAAPAHHHRRPGRGRHQARRHHRRRLAAGADPHARPGQAADGALQVRALGRQAAALPAHLPAARGRLRRRRGDRLQTGRSPSDRKVQSLFLLGPRRPEARPQRHARPAVPQPRRQPLRRRHAAAGRRHAGRPARARHHPPLHAHELAGHGPEGDARQHRAGGTQGAARGAAPDRPA